MRSTVFSSRNCSRVSMKTEKKHFMTIAFVWVCCFVLLSAVYMLVLAPQKKERKRIEMQLADTKQRHDAALEAGKDETKVRLKSQIEKLRKRLEDFAIDSEDAANLTFDISQIATDKEVGAFSVRSVDKPGGSALPDCKQLRENRIDVSFTAGFNQFAAFLNALEQHRPVVFISEFTITRARKGDAGHAVDMNLAVFVRKQQAG